MSHTQPRNDVSPVPKIQGKAKSRKMAIDFLYGTRLSENEVSTLLSGKRCISKINHADTVIFPDVVLNEYNGRIGYKWKCERLR